MLWILRAAVVVSLVVSPSVLARLLAAQQQSNVGTFLHITDTHTDLRFHPGAPTHCVQDDLFDGLGCCHKLDLASATKPVESCSVWGSFNCDASPHWTTAALAWIADNIHKQQPFDFVIHTGDFTSHHDITQTPWENQGAVDVVTSLMEEAFPNTTILPVLGNHDGWPVDNTTPLIDDFMLANISQHWEPLLGKGAAKDVAYGGYYTKLMTRGLRYVGLNILWFDTNNIFKRKLSNSTAYNPRETWTWLNTTLQTARENKEKVWMGFHFGISKDSIQNLEESPDRGGEPEASYGYSVRLAAFFEEFQDVLVQTFCGHTHSHDFFVYMTSTNKPLMSCIAPGALYPAGHNPQFSVLSYDRTTFEVVDYDHYVCDLNTTIKLNKPVCQLAYNFGQAYGASNINAATILSLHDQMTTNNTMMQFYFEQNRPGDNYDNKAHPNAPCDSHCRQKLLSNMLQPAPAPYRP